MEIIMKKFIVLAILLSGCTSGSISPVNVNNKAALDDKTARASMGFTLDGGATMIGIATTDRKPQHKIVFFLPDKAIKLMITTCSREEFFGYPEYKRGFAYTYVPVPNLEDTESCFMTATAITDKGATYKSIIDFRGTESLPASVACNGRIIPAIGVAFCQGREGLTQMISFNEPVAYAAQGICPDLLPGTLPNSYELKLGKNFCAYKFMDKDKRVFRLTTFGYTMINEVVLDGG
jgi:hypothetical protein